MSVEMAVTGEDLENFTENGYMYGVPKVCHNVLKPYLGDICLPSPNACPLPM